MGCDFHWEGTATEEQQRLCGWFTESLFDADENGISRYFPGFMKCDIYDGDYTGLFLEVGPPEDRGPSLQTVRLVGATIHPEYYVDSEPGFGLWASGQLSFVFITVGENLGELVTVEPIADITKLRYEWIRERFESCEVSSDTPLVTFRRRGQDRLLANVSWLANLLYAIKKQCMPRLHVGDDYLIFAGIAERGLLDDGFSRAILKPELAGKWGFDLNDLEHVFSRVDALFHQDRIENLGLSRAALETLARAEVFSLSDLTYGSKDWFVTIYKPNHDVLLEIEEAMLLLGYSFEPDPIRRDLPIELLDKDDQVIR